MKYCTVYIQYYLNIEYFSPKNLVFYTYCHYCVLATNITFSSHLFFLSEKETEIDLCPPIGRLHKEGTNHKRTIGTEREGGHLSQHFKSFIKQQYRFR